MKGISGIRFILFYVIFLGFFLIIMGLGGAQYVATGFNVTIASPPTPAIDPISQLIYVVQNIGMLFTLMLLNPFHPTIILLHFIITLPALSVLIYIVLVLIRGGGA